MVNPFEELSPESVTGGEQWHALPLGMMDVMTLCWTATTRNERLIVVAASLKSQLLL
jgi:hypothetical protein